MLRAHLNRQTLPRNAFQLYVIPLIPQMPSDEISDPGLNPHSKSSPVRKNTTTSEVNLEVLSIKGNAVNVEKARDSCFDTASSLTSRCSKQMAVKRTVRASSTKARRSNNEVIAQEALVTHWFEFSCSI